MSVPVDQLTVEQLASVRQQLDQEIQHLTQSFAALKQAEAKFKSCKEALESVNANAAEKDILVPLTSSLYVSGKLSDTSNVIVDVGTGYFVEKSVKEARIFYNSKAMALRKNLEEIQPTIEQKEENRQLVINLHQQKLIWQRQQAAKQESSS
ncbi:uncharacterized protein L969DRAFT_95872 [Mixia osmundae IAM 14324]|uniref:Prefoldin alpha subunit n=1 Tax=Mixia osmundae (strain CBS 9802 / IAM 14324 / JCM 22182 / KY 12970) TaxID=764103 RepID=G7EAT6_MIXOS|nr:uncharacterized protein L969DRAFT_95872 [Mixia osmundae IAM 14324]KEI38030.1 hypothetical protein L969DRAFT_95872 [Mixia osmundae IAM 14324]GAA99946.1 hypothetical protein E5Q_06649 [Mixia osmundae IAM 14324]